MRHKLSALEVTYKVLEISLKAAPVTAGFYVYKALYTHTHSRTHRHTHTGTHAELLQELKRRVNGFPESDSYLLIIYS